MPVRSRGSLLAGTATLAGLLLAGLGCHSSPSDHDSFSMRNTTGQTSDGFVSQGDAAVPSAGYVAQPAVRYGPAPASAPVTLQPVPIAQSAGGRREVIASTFQPVLRVSAVQTVSGPELQGGAPPVAAGTPLMPARLPTGAPMPIGNSGAVGGSWPRMEENAAASPGNNVLPPPRTLAAPSNTVVYNGGLPPAHPPYPHIPREFEKMALPPYVVEPPDILLIQASNHVTLRLQPIQAQHLVGPDGTINLGIYGKIRVAGMTLDQVADAVATRLLEIMPGLQRGIPVKVDKDGNVDKNSDDSAKVWKDEFQQQGVNPVEMIKKEMQVDVLIYNSKFYYVITDFAGAGEQVARLPHTGNETVLDAMSLIGGLSAVSSRKIWVARPSPTECGHDQILPVDWCGITRRGEVKTNYQLMPFDRIYVLSAPLSKIDTYTARVLSPISRILSTTLLGAETVQTIANPGGTGVFLPVGVP